MGPRKLIGVGATVAAVLAGAGPGLAAPVAQGALAAMLGPGPAPAPAALARRPGAVWVRHLNCGTTRPPFAPFSSGEGAWNERGRLVCHCLLVGTPGGLLLVDTGMGTRDVAAPAERFLSAYRWMVGPRLVARETAVAQLGRLGFRPSDVTDVAITHLDLDHVGGLADFPQARVHVLAPELARYQGRDDVDRLAAMRFTHGVRWVAHRADGPRWLGFRSSPIEMPGADIRLVSLPGHTPGHAGVAIHDGTRWLLHAGDAYMHRSELDPRPKSPAGLALFRFLRDEDDRARRQTVAALRTLRTRWPGQVTLFSAHDPVELADRQEADVRFAAIRTARR